MRFASIQLFIDQLRRMSYMSILSEDTILKQKDRKTIDEYFKQNPNLCAFCSYPTIEMYLNSSLKECHLVETEDGLRFVTRTKGDFKDIRILFDEQPHDQQLAEQLILEEKPLHIGFSHVEKPSMPWEDCKPYPEVIIDLTPAFLAFSIT